MMTKIGNKGATQRFKVRYTSELKSDKVEDENNPKNTPKHADECKHVVRFHYLSTILFLRIYDFLLFVECYCMRYSQRVSYE